MGQAQTATTPSAVMVADALSVMSGPLPQDAPKWFLSANEMLRLAPWEGSWVVLLASWLKYELKNDLHDDGKLRMTHRPACIAVWIACARLPKWWPPIKDVEQFEEEFWNWWKGLQPGWRKDLQWGDGDLATLHKPGANGVVSVLAGLFYWGMALGDHPEGSSGWSQAVEDVNWLLHHL
jgi:hypothetical protein